MTEKTTKALIGIGVIGLAAYYYLNQQTEESTTLGGSGSFAGLGGLEEATGGALDNLAGTSESGISYNINLPEVDYSGLSNLINAPEAVEDSNTVITSKGDSEPVLTKKAATTAKDSTKAETSGSLSSSLAQVFGTEAQKTNERGDYYTTAAGGGAGAIKGQSLGQMALNLLTGKTASGKTVSSTLPTGASTAADPKYDLSGVDVKAVLEADKTKKEQMQTAINQTKIAAPSANPVTDVMSYLKSGGTLTNESTGATITAKTNTASSTTTKKQATTSTYKEGGQTKYKDASGKTHIVVKKKK
jgi:hypothetical protein